ncbi:MAG: diadenylate cyclase CdaA [Bacteroidia bacterium]
MEIISFTISDGIDIFLVAIILYLFYNLVKGTAAINIFIGLAFIYLIYFLVRAAELELLSSLLGKFVNVGVIVVMIVFQQEIRKFLLFIGSNEMIKKGNFKKIIRLNLSEAIEQTEKLAIDEIVRACFNMSETKTGALIVICRKSDLKYYIQTGIILDSVINEKAIENVFFKNSPLHDGAIIIRDNRIVAARCVLPVSEREDFPVQLGMRHRAAVGISEATDAIALSVSEQTGAVSLTIKGDLRSNLNKEELRIYIEKYYAEP